MASRRSANWFDVSREGLAKLMEGRGKAWCVHELIQNALDEQDVTEIDVFVKYEGRGLATIMVTDDSPTGFADLTHAFTLFAESYKKTDPTKRGRFNAGEKMLLAMCVQASIASTTGTVRFSEAEGRSVHPARRTERGTMVTALVRMTQDETAEVIDAVHDLLVPPGITLRLNTVDRHGRHAAEVVARREIVRTFTASLKTPVADDSGVLRLRTRDSRVELFRVRAGREGRLFEMGIPVCETGDDFDVNVHQKVPLDMERRTVHPSYLRAIRAATLDAVADLLAHNPQLATQPWVTDALESPAVSDDAVRSVVAARFGDKPVAYDLKDPEANKRATADGFKVVHGGSMSAAAWARAKALNLVPPAGQVRPTPKPFSESGAPIKTLGTDHYTPRHAAFAQLAVAVAATAIDKRVVVRFVTDGEWNRKFNGAYGPDGVLYVSNAFVKGTDSAEQALDFLIHEYGHEFSGDHLSSKYHDALTMIGARLASRLAARDGAADVLKALTALDAVGVA